MVILGFDLLNLFKAGLAENEIAAIAAHSLRGLAFLHNEKVIHRDVKAANLFLTEDGSVVCAMLAGANPVYGRFVTRICLLVVDV